MLWRWRLLSLLVLVFATAPMIGSADETDSSSEVKRNARLLRQWKADPEHYARLQRDWQAFRALPHERQERLRRLDRDLHAVDGQTQRRLWKVLERYHTWLGQLPSADRSRIEETANPGDRLRLIQEMRDKQWLAYLPQETLRKALDTELKASPDQQRSVILLKYKNQERQRRHHHSREPGRHKPGGKDSKKIPSDQ